MSPSKHKYGPLNIHRSRGIHRNRVILSLKILAGIFFGCLVVALLSSKSHKKLSVLRKIAHYPSVFRKTDEYAQFEVVMKSQEKKIVFIETSTGENFCLKVRQSCAVESAARLNPEAVVVLLMRAASILPNCTTTSLLGIIPNVRLLRYTVNDVFEDTPLLEWGQGVESGEVRSPYIKSHLSDALRLAIVHKYSAIYADLDFIVLRSFDKLFSLKGFLGLEASAYLNGALIGFSGLKDFTAQAMEEFRNTYRGHEWGFNGPQLMRRMLEKWGCAVTESECKGVTIFGTEAFYPVHWTAAKKLFDDNAVDFAFNMLNNEKIYAIHFWNYLTSEFQSPVHFKNVLNICGQMKCPTTFELASENGTKTFR